MPQASAPELRRSCAEYQEQSGAFQSSLPFQPLCRDSGTRIECRAQLAIATTGRLVGKDCDWLGHRRGRLAHVISQVLGRRSRLA